MSAKQFCLFNGSRDSNKHTGAEYSGITWQEIVMMAEDSRTVDKEKAPAIVPSLYREFDARTHDVQREKGVFHLICFDFDEGNLTLEQVKSAIRAVFGNVAYLIYSSRGATMDNMKWRAIVPVKQEITGADFNIKMRVINNLVAAKGVNVDRALERPAQPVFLPNKGEHYETHTHKAPALGALEDVNGFTEAHKDLLERIEAQHAEAKAKAAERAAQRALQSGDEDDNPMIWFNSKNDVEELMLRYGYTKVGRDFKTPQSTSGSYAVRIFDQVWLSLSDSDVGSGLGRASDSGYCSGDAYDLFVHYEHQGDNTAAWRAIRKTMPATQSVETFSPNTTAQAAAGPARGPSVDQSRDQSALMLAVDSKGHAPFNHHNAVEFITKTHEWEKVFAYDDFAQRKMLMKMMPGTPGNPDFFKPREIRDSDYTRVLRWFNLNGFLRASKSVICDAVDAACEETIIDPPRLWLTGLAEKYPNPNMDLLNNWAIDTLGAKYETDDQEQYVRAVSRKWVISAVARALRPGCKADGVLIMEGMQGTGKSTALSVLAGEDWFGDALPPMGTKDAADYVRGKWIIELAELSNINKAEVEVAKAYISRTEERFRPAYGRSEITYPRHCVFAGTINKADYLRDETGNRRFWPIKCGKVDLAKLKSIREELFAAAVVAFNNGEKWWLTEDEDIIAQAEQGQRLPEDVWVDVIRTWTSEHGRTEVTIQMVAKEALFLDQAMIGRQSQNRITAALSAIGFEKETERPTSGEFRNKTVYTQRRKT